MIWSRVAFLLLAFLVVIFFVWWNDFSREPYGHFTNYQIETTLTWPDGPDVELTTQSMKKLNEDVSAQLQKEAAREDLIYPVVSNGKKWVEVMYISDKPGPSKELQQKLNSFIQQRAGELAKEQVNASTK